MFSFLKPNPIRKMKKDYFSLLEKAMHAQRSGDIKTYSMLTANAEALWLKIEALENKN